VTTVYVDVAAACLDGSAAAAPDPEAVRSLRHLADAGVRVVLVQADAQEPAAELRAVGSEIIRTIPPRPAGPAYYLTSDIARCQGSSAHLRTVLIGAAPPSGTVRRCDAVARDVQAAAMEILVDDAMAPGDPAPA
jgi:hypothetical protein